MSPHTEEDRCRLLRVRLWLRDPEAVVTGDLEALADDHVDLVDACTIRLGDEEASWQHRYRASADRLMQVDVWPLDETQTWKESARTLPHHRREVIVLGSDGIEAEWWSHLNPADRLSEVMNFLFDHHIPFPETTRECLRVAASVLRWQHPSRTLARQYANCLLHLPVMYERSNWRRHMIRNASVRNVLTFLYPQATEPRPFAEVEWIPFRDRLISPVRAADCPACRAWQKATSASNSTSP